MTEKDQERAYYGKASSLVGITVNVCLFVMKFFVGRVFHSVAITADAVNNLSDAGSALISLVSFKLSSKPADQEHPFGHERIEYLASLVVGFLILLLGWELLQSSLGKVLQPEEVNYSFLLTGVLLFSIGAKFGLYKYYLKIAQRLNSSILKATATDSFSDVMATSAILLSLFLSPLLGFQLDGYIGLAVSLLIMFSGVKILKEMLDTLLGQKPPQEFVQQLEAYFKQYKGVLGTHDLVIHNYGPRRSFVSVHVEVDARKDILESHDLMDNIEGDIARDLGIHLVIHMDPLTLDDPLVNSLREMTVQIVAEVEPSLSMHDFRVVKGVTHTNLIFDLVVPYQCVQKENLMINEITQKIKEKGPNLFAVINIDRSYV